MGVSAAVDLESDCETVLRVGKRNALELRRRHREVQRVDDQKEHSGHLPFETERADTCVDPRAALGGTIKVDEQAGNAEIGRSPQVELLVGEWQPENDGAVPIECARSYGRGAIDRNPGVPLGIETERPVLADTEASAERSRGRWVVDGA